MEGQIASCISFSGTETTTIPHFTLKRDLDSFSILFWLYLGEGGRKGDGGVSSSCSPDGVVIFSYGSLKMRIKDGHTFVVTAQNVKDHCFSFQSKFSSTLQELVLNRWVHVSFFCCLDSLTLLLNGSCQTRTFFVGPLKTNLSAVCIGSVGVVGFVMDFRWYNSIPDGNFIQLLQNEKPKFPPDTAPPKSVTVGPLKSVAALDQWDVSTHGSNTQHFISRCPLKLRPRRSTNNGKPQLIHCHDMAGNYLEDRFVNGGESFHVYNFRYWQYIDIFIYFSHERVTIPPPSWITAAHKNGVKILGTFITEWGPGEPENILLLHGKDNNPFYYCDKLIQIAQFYGFDGWFFNFESKITEGHYVTKLADFLRYITQKMHQVIPHSIILWYDSVTVDGDLKWQNRLNEKNFLFFDCCDGIFLNYTWKPDYIQSSSVLAKERKFSVFTGIDIFGRGTFGGGGFDTYKALDVIFHGSSEGVGTDSPQTSVALFAPGWTFEVLAKNDRFMFDLQEAKFWTGNDFIDLMEKDQQKWSILASGGDGWKKLPVSESYNRMSDNAFVTSFSWCKRCKTIDLLKLGIESSLLDQSPPVVASVWHQGTPPSSDDYFYLHIKLLDQNQTIISELKLERRTTATWTNEKHAFLNYPSGLRFIYWEDGGKDTEYWAGHYGARIDAPSLILQLPQKSKSIAFYRTPSVVPINRLPFVTCFNQGIGNRLWMDGNEISPLPWNNMFDQDVLPNESVVIEGSPHVQSQVDYSCAYYGGASYKIVINFEQKRNYSQFRLFHVNLEQIKSPSITVSYAFRLLNQHHKNNNNVVDVDVALVLQTSETERFYFTSESKDDHSIVLMDESSSQEPKQCAILPTSTSLHGSWIYRSYKTELMYGKTIQYVDVKVFQKQTAAVGAVAAEGRVRGSCHLNLGCIKMVEETEEQPLVDGPVRNFSGHVSWNHESIQKGRFIADVWLTWEECEREHILCYCILDEKHNFIGRSFSDRFVLYSVDVSEELSFILQPVTRTLTKTKPSHLSIAPFKYQQ